MSNVMTLRTSGARSAAIGAAGGRLEEHGPKRGQVVRRQRRRAGDAVVGEEQDARGAGAPRDADVARGARRPTNGTRRCRPRSARRRSVRVQIGDQRRRTPPRPSCRSSDRRRRDSRARPSRASPAAFRVARSRRSGTTAADTVSSGRTARHALRASRTTSDVRRCGGTRRTRPERRSVHASGVGDAVAIEPLRSAAVARGPLLRPELRERVGAVIEIRAGIADVVEVHAVDRVSRRPARERRSRCTPAMPARQARDTALRRDRTARASIARARRHTPATADRSGAASRRARAAPSAIRDAPTRRARAIAGSVAPLATRLTLTHAWTRRPARCASSTTVASGSKLSGWLSSSVARGSMALRVERFAASAHLHEQRVESRPRWPRRTIVAIDRRRRQRRCAAPTARGLHRGLRRVRARTATRPARQAAAARAITSRCESWASACGAAARQQSTARMQCNTSLTIESVDILTA